MREQEQINSWVTGGLAEATGVSVVWERQGAQRPELPYLTVALASARVPGRGTWADCGGEYRREVGQVWSVTAHAAQEGGAAALAHAAAVWLELDGRLYLQDREIVVQRVGETAGRSAASGLDGACRQGFDVTLALLDIVPKAAGELAEIIETAELSAE